MTDVRLTATNPTDSTVVPVACNERGELLTTAPVIEKIPNDVEIDGNLTVGGTLTGPDGEPITSGEPGPPGPEGPEGPEGPPGQDLDLKPYGPENSYLMIKDAKPTWVTASEAPLPPGPEYPVMLIDQRDLSAPEGLTDWGAYSDAGTFVLPPKTWDEYIREQDAWATPAAQRTGLCAQKAGDLGGKGMKLPFQLNLVGGFEKILRVIVAAESVNCDSATKTQLSLSYDTTYLSPLVGQINEREGDGPSFHELTYLVNRPDIGIVNFELNHALSMAPNNAKALWCGVQSWGFVDPAFYLLNRVSSRLQEVSDLLD